MKVAVVGGGLGGCAAALGLRNMEADVTVYEAAAGPRRGGHGLSLFPKGTSALAALGLPEVPGEPVEQLTAVHPRSGKALSSTDLRPVTERLGHPYIASMREQVLDLLLGGLEGRVLYGKRCTRVSTSESHAEVDFADGSAGRFDLVVAADGSNSAVRSAEWPGEERRLTSVAWQGEVATPDWYGNRREAMLVRAPCATGGIFPGGADWVGWYVEERADSPAPAQIPLSELPAHFSFLPAAFREVVAATGEGAVGAYPIYVRRPPRHWSKGRIALLGDAAHSLSPSIGQGSSEAFIDAVSLAYALRHHGSVDDALHAYSRDRYRRSLANWRMSLWSLKPFMSRVTAASGRMPEPIITRSLDRILGPPPVVRRALDARDPPPPTPAAAS